MRPRPASRSRLSRSRSLAGSAAAVLALSLGVAGCSGGGSGGSDSGGEHEETGTVVTAVPTPSTARPRGTTVKITIGTDDVDPTGSRVDVARGKPVTLLITAVKAGELHVHSSPEQHVDFPKGTSAATLTLKQPGVVEVEDHALDKLIVQLEVR